MKLGTYTTIDAPTEKIDEAEKFLTDEFTKISALVYKKSNPHDFGNYPSFEIDYPDAIEDAKDGIETNDLYREDADEDIPEHILKNWITDDEAEMLQIKVDEFTDQADEIETAYSNKFFKE